MAPGVLIPEDSLMEGAASSTENTPLSANQPSSPPALLVGDVPNDASDKENRTTKLEDMFDDDTDDELLSSLAQADSSQIEAGYAPESNSRSLF